MMNDELMGTTESKFIKVTQSGKFAFVRKSQIRSCFARDDEAGSLLHIDKQQWFRCEESCEVILGLLEPES